ncbi:MAG: hypothetical protein KGN02_13200 [bacterium]|nr:hypothetical protein [bacterium]
MLVAGIDGGQSSTTAVVADERGTILGYGYAGAADELGERAGSTRLRDALESALADAARACGLAPQTRFAAIVAGVSGYEGRLVGEPPRMPTDRFVLVHDAPIAHAGALGGGDGVTVIAGTGSVAYATAGGRARRVGGLGYLFGDEGSAFWIARRAVSAAARHDDCDGIARLLSYFDVHAVREIVARFYAGAISRADLAAFAPFVIAAARDGDSCACIAQPAVDAASALAELAFDAALEPGAPVRVSFVGGLVRDPWFGAQLHARTTALFAARGSEALLVEPQADPAVGAAILARRG